LTVDGRQWQKIVSIRFDRCALELVDKAGAAPIAIEDGGVYPSCRPQGAATIMLTPRRNWMTNLKMRAGAVIRASLLAATTIGGITLASVAYADPVTLTWGMWAGSDAEVAAWQHVADMVTAKYPDITIKLQTASWPDYWTKLPTLAASNQLPDIVSLQSLRTPGFASLLTPLDDLAKRDSFDLTAFDKSIIGGLSSDGHVVALPYDFGPLITYYNADMFKKAGLTPPAPGWTVADMVKDAKTLTSGSTYGFGIGGVDQVASWAVSAGIPYLKDGNVDFGSAKLAAVFQDYVDLVAKDKVAPLLPSSGGAQLGDMSRGGFAAGNIAMVVDGPWQLINLKNSVKFTMGIAPVPAGAAGSIGVTAGSGFGISAASQHQDDAWKAIQVLTGPDAEQYLASQGRAFAARIADQQYWYANADGVDNVKSAMAAALATAVPEVTTANWNTINNLFEQYEPLALSGKQSAADTLATIGKLSNQ
jgi:ABC-type glycerol-3-phosphate transport system substrate-binding protein